MFDYYRKHWFDIGFFLAIAISGILILTWDKISYIQLLHVMNFVVLLLHQFEEYRWPGYLPGQMNGGLFKSDMPDRYPANPHSILIVNTAGAYPLYILPIIFPEFIWLGLGPVFVAIAQVPAHGILMPIRAKQYYSPGMATAFFLWLPICYLYLKTISDSGLVSSMDWVLGTAYFLVSAIILIQGPVQFFKDRNTPYRFTVDQLGRWGTA